MENKRTKKAKDLVVRPLCYDDLEAVEEMDELSGNGVTQWVRDLIGGAFNDYSWGIFLKGELIGYCTIGYADDMDCLEDYPGYTCDSLLLSDVYVKCEYRGNGYALKMIKEVIDCRTEKEKELVFLTLLYDDLSRLYSKIDFQWAFDTKEYIMVLDKRN